MEERERTGNRGKLQCRRRPGQDNEERKTECNPLTDMELLLNSANSRRNPDIPRQEIRTATGKGFL
jgi:hypothetical protein